MNDRFVSLLCLCRKAGRLVVGFDRVKESMQTGAASLVVLASDASPKTKKETVYIAAGCSVRVVECDATVEELWYKLGKRSAVLSVTDPGLAARLLETAAS